MSRPLPRYRPDTDPHKLDRIIDNTEQPPAPRATLPGDTRRLRGIPVTGVGGTSPGTDPAGVLIHKDHLSRTTTRYQRRPISKWLRGWIIDRDQATCYLCGLKCKDHEIHIDHVTPVSRGGDNHPKNLRVACATCNLRKSNITLNDPPPLAHTVKRPATFPAGRPPQPHAVAATNEKRRNRRRKSA